ncbi:MAG: MOP flippase family protein [Candidatus Eiseniibacteriota bacterium]|jgi:PST family polysaccharide transporter
MSSDAEQSGQTAPGPPPPPGPPDDGVGSSAKRGIAWSLSSNVVIQAFQFAVGIVLARLLDPADFGVFAITAIFTGLAANLANVGLGSALVQRPAIDEQHRRTMLTTNLVTSAVIVVVLVLLAPWVGSYFQHDLAGPILCLVSFNFIINSLSSVSFSLMARDLRFRPIAIVEALAMVAHGTVAIALALAGFGVWSIAWGGIAQSACRCVMLLAIGGWVPHFAWNRRAFRDLISFGAALTVKRLLNYCAANVDYFVIGRRLGPTSLGYYTRAYSLMTLPLNQVSRVVMSVLFPAFSRIQDDNPRLVRGYERVVTATALLSFPFLAGLGVVAPVFIGFVYGDKWQPTVLPLQIMCLAGMMKSVSTFCGTIVNAKGVVVAEIRRQGVYLLMLVIGTSVGSRWGTTGVAWAVVGASLAMLIMMQSLLNRLIGMRWRDYLWALTPPLAASAVMVVAVQGVIVLLGRHLAPHSPLLLVSGAVVGAAIYVTLIRLMPFPRLVALRRELVGDLRRALAGRRGRPPGPAARTDEEAACPESPESSSTRASV